MNEILNQFLKEGDEYKIKRAKISKDGKTLTIQIALNFDLSKDEIERIKESIVQKTEVENIELELQYENLISKKKRDTENRSTFEEIITNLFPKVLKALTPQTAAMLRAVTKEDIEVTGKHVKIFVMGEFLVQSLNKKGKAELEKVYLKESGIDIEIEFGYHEEKLGTAKENIEKIKEIEKEKDLLEAKERQQKRATQKKRRRKSKWFRELK